MLGRIVVSDIRQALTPEALARLLSDVVRNYSAGESSEITIFLNKEDLERLEKNYLYKLREGTKKSIILRPAEEISGGFMISFDDEKSRYDFTDRALADYIGTYLKPKLNQVLLESVKE
jgi:vacuolar-type H+-ATPase subunit E/Vma4